MDTVALEFEFFKKNIKRHFESDSENETQFITNVKHALRNEKNLHDHLVKFFSVSPKRILSPPREEVSAFQQFTKTVGAAFQNMLTTQPSPKDEESSEWKKFNALSNPTQLMALGVSDIILLGKGATVHSFTGANMTLDENGKVVSGNIPYAEYICKVLEKMLQEENNTSDPWRQFADSGLLKLGDPEYTKVVDEYRAKFFPSSLSR
jgi:hypothetical protein